MKNLMETLSVRSELGYNSKHQELSPKDYEQLKANLYNDLEGDLNEKDGYNCPICKNKGQIAKVQYNEMFCYYYEAHVPCKCVKVRRIIHKLNRSGLKNVGDKYTFEKYQTPEEWNKIIKNTAMKFCKDKENNWFFIGGQSGSGKTHICTAIALDYINQEKEVRYMLWRDEITKIKAVVNDPDQYGKIMDELKKTDVLYIDDLFKSGKDDYGKYKAPTAADVNAAFEIINYRYNNPALITIISSERTLVELDSIDEAIAGRIAEKSKDSGYCINLKPDKSRNWRMKGLLEL